MIEVVLLGIALSMDAFAVSITLGLKNQKHAQVLALYASLYFGLFQGIMPLIGYLGGAALLGWIGNISHWIAFILLLIIGVKMIYEGYTSTPDVNPPSFSHKAMLVLAIATSIDAMAAGFSLTQLSVDALSACAIIGLTTFLFSYVGVIIGVISRENGAKWLIDKVEIFGGAVLILIGLKILFY